jgi:hypothetical protein
MRIRRGDPEPARGATDPLFSLEPVDAALPGTQTAGFHHLPQKASFVPKRAFSMKLEVPRYEIGAHGRFFDPVAEQTGTHIRPESFLPGENGFESGETSQYPADSARRFSNKFPS